MSPHKHKKGNNMTPLEFKEARKRLNKTQQDIAIQFGVSVRTVKRYESGDTQIPYSIEALFDKEGLGESRIVGEQEYAPLEEIVNSHDRCFCIDIEVDCGYQHTYLLGCDLDGDHIAVTEYMKGDRIYTTGRYLEAGSWFYVECVEFDFKTIVDAFVKNFSAKIVDVIAPGVGFTDNPEV